MNPDKTKKNPTHTYPHSIRLRNRRGVEARTAVLIVVWKRTTINAATKRIDVKASRRTLGDAVLAVGGGGVEDVGAYTEGDAAIGGGGGDISVRSCCLFN